MKYTFTLYAKWCLSEDQMTIDDINNLPTVEDCEDHDLGYGGEDCSYDETTVITVLDENCNEVANYPITDLPCLNKSISNIENTSNNSSKIILKRQIWWNKQNYELSDDSEIKELDYIPKPEDFEINISKKDSGLFVCPESGITLNGKDISFECTDGAGCHSQWYLYANGKCYNVEDDDGELVVEDEKED